MNYNIHITSTAERDITNAADYIEFVLKNPDAADNLLELTEKQINSLSEMPDRFHIVDDAILASWGIRFIIVNNYLAFYIVDNKHQLVIVVRFLYKKSNWNSILRGGFSLI